MNLHEIENRDDHGELVSILMSNYLGVGATVETALAGIKEDIATGAMFTDENLATLETTKDALTRACNWVVFIWERPKNV